MKINKEVLKMTTECNRDFICLSSNGKHINCKVVNCVNDKVHFVESQLNCTSSYIMNFGFTLTCNCPVRKEIFNKYGI